MSRANVKSWGNTVLPRAVVAAGTLFPCLPSTAIGVDLEEAETQDRPRTMRLAEVLEVMVHHSPALMQASIDVGIAEGRLLQAAGLDDLRIGLRSFVQTERSASLPGTLLTSKLDEARFEASVSRSFSTGTQFELRLETIYDRNNLNFEGGFNGAYSGSVAASIVQPLLRGRGDTVARAPRYRAERERDIATLNRIATASRAVREAIAAYWELAYAGRDLEIQRASLELAEDWLSTTRKRIKSGTVASSEALAVEQVIAERCEAVLDAEVRLIERAVDLRRLVGLDLNPSAIELVTADTLQAAPRQHDRAAVIQQALTHHPDVALAQARRRRADFEFGFARSQGRPRLDLEVSASSLGVSDEIADTFRQVGSVQGYTLTANLVFERPLENRHARGLLGQARAGLSRSSAQLRDVRASVTIEAARAVKQARTAAFRIELGEGAMKLSSRNIDAEKARFTIGRTTNFDVLARQDDHRKAQLRYARAVADYLIAAVAIRAVTGTILSDYGIEF